jgi:RimJ/RimL family protein N-acetyltransferase
MSAHRGTTAITDVSLEPLDARFLAAVDADGAFVGLGLVPSVDRPGAEAELGYIVTREARGRGVATAILGVLVKQGQRSDAVLWSRLPGDPS